MNTLAKRDRGDAFEKALKAFGDFAKTRGYQEEERGYKERLVRTLGDALKPSAFGVRSFKPGLSEAVQRCSAEIDNLTHYTDRDDFQKYLKAVSAERLRNVLYPLLFDRGALEDRIDTFRAGVNADYARHLPRKRVYLGLISLLLASNSPDQFPFYRWSIIDRACRDWKWEPPYRPSAGATYAAYLDWIKPIQARLGEVLERPADPIDVHSLLWDHYSTEKAREMPGEEEGESPGGPAPPPATAPEIAALRRISDRTRNIILHGPPGTGKTYWAQAFADAFAGVKRTAFVTFHPSFAYEDFVEGLRPVASPRGLTYRVVDGVFKQVCRKAQEDPGGVHLLVIDEINRGNISKTFGELITLLEDDKRTGRENALEVILPYSREPFGVPPNLYILGTMNSADRSIALIDTALRRRFAFVEVAPQPGLLDTVAGVDLRGLLEGLNRRLEALLDRDHRVGHSYLLDARDGGGLHFAWYHRVVPLLQEYFHDDGERLMAVLGEAFVRPLPVDGATRAAVGYLYDADSPGYEVRSLEGEAFLDALRGLASPPARDDEASS